MADRNGALWFSAADSGLFHVRGNGTDRYARAEGLSGDYVAALLEDREGNIWVATTSGIDRFRRPTAVVYSHAQGVNGRVVSVLSASDGAVWSSTTTGLYRLDRQRVELVRSGPAATLVEDARGRIWSSTEHELGYFQGRRFVSVQAVPKGPIDALKSDAGGNVWIAHRTAGIYRLLLDGNVEHVPWSRLLEVTQSVRPFRSDADPGQVSAMTVDPADGSLWLAMASGPLLNIARGTVRRTLGVENPDEFGRVRQIRVDSNGGLWISAGNGLHFISGERQARLSSINGLPCNRMYWSNSDESFVWLFMECGLVQLARRDVDAWARPDGTNAPKVVPVKNYWDHIRYMKTSSIGSRIRDVSFFNPKAELGRDGRVWLATQNGVAVVDPARLPFNQLPPPVHVRQIVSDGTLYEPNSHLQLPPLPRNLEIEYIGLSLTDPEKTQYRYMLEGRDTAWQDAGNRRRAFYTDLPPRHYRFRVIAANNSGVWNEYGATLDFSVAPTWYQTRLFLLLSILFTIGLVSALYRWRVRHVARTINAIFNERLAERTRVARDLHDTLLQTVQGSKMVVDNALNSAGGQTDMRRAMEQLSGWLGQATKEGRDAVDSLRISTIETNDLAAALTRAIDDCRRHSALQPSLSVTGEHREMHPVARDEVYRVEYEAIRNACAHSTGTRLDVAITYGRDLIVRVSDNGCGVDPVTATLGKQGHFGLQGMRERSQRIGATLDIVSAPNDGTTVTMTVPGVVIFRRRGGFIERIRTHFN